MFEKRSKNDAVVTLILWAIAIVTSGLLLAGSEQAQYVILIQAVCMIGSVYYSSRSCGKK